MKGALVFGLLLLPFAGCWAQEPAVAKERLRVNVEGVDEKGGNVHIAIHGPSTFMKDGRALTGLILPPMGKTGLSGLLQAVPHGTYAVAVYQDMNGNDRLDKNALGIPTEPYAFSNNPVVKWQVPSFEDAAVDIGQEGKGVTVRLKYWKAY